MDIRVECLGIVEALGSDYEDYYIRIKEIDGERYVDIAAPEHVVFIIESARKNIQLPADLLTYSMFHSILIMLGVTVEKVVLTDVEGESLSGLVWIEHDKKTIVTYAGAIDAIALAVTTSCPIYITRSAFDDIEELNLKRLKEDQVAWLEGMDEDNPQ